tara:strand:+ start:1138 stop:1587 length:450 start_codon:yes stop_codon:yes gene_type:complete
MIVVKQLECIMVVKSVMTIVKNVQSLMRKKKMKTINDYEKESSLVNNVIEFLKKVFNLKIEVKDFYNKDLYPFYKAEFSSYNNLIYLSFPSFFSSNNSSLVIKVFEKDVKKINFKNITFEYNKGFEKEVLKINNLSVEDVFQNEYYKSI